DRNVTGVQTCALPICLQQGVPLPAPDHLDDVPAGAPERGFQLLDDLAVAAHRAVQALQVAVDHEGEVVQLLPGGEVRQPAGLRQIGRASCRESGCGAA